MNLRDNPIVIERGKITASQFVGKKYDEDDVWAYVTTTWPSMSTEMTQQVESAAYRELEATDGRVGAIASGYYAVRDSVGDFARFLKDLNEEDAQVLHDYLAGKIAGRR